MATTIHVLRTLSILASLSLLLPGAGAWSNGGYSADPNNPDYGTHDWIAEMALTLQIRDVTFLTTTYHSLFLLGTEAPDNGAYIGDTSKHHVYFHSTGVLQDDICAIRASQIYNTALGYMLEGDNHSAAYDIGVLAHYVSDVGVFGHTMGSYTDWGAETHHSDYESEMNSRIHSLSPPTGLALRDSDAYNATLDLARNTTFGGGAVKPNVWMDTHYDWANETFETSAMASLYGSIGAVAAVINHLLKAASYSQPTPQPQPQPQPQPLPSALKVPQPPTTLSLMLQGSHIVLTWTPPAIDGGASVTSYVIFRGTGSESPSYLATVSGDINSWSDESVVKGKTYHYWVVAENSVGRSDMTLTASIAVPYADSLLLAIVLTVISGVSASGGLLLWRRRTRGRALS